MKKIFYILLGSPLLFSQGTLLAQNFVNGGNNLGAVGRLGTTSNQSLAFITGNTERARITNSGRFGIGTSSPVTRFHVNGVSSFGKNVTTSNATRVLNLVDDNAVMRVLRVHPTFAPAVELISRISADGANVAYWDFYAEPSDASFRIRDRIGGGLKDRVTITKEGNVVIGSDPEDGGFGGSLEVNGDASIASGLRVAEGLRVGNYGIIGLNAEGDGVIGSSRGGNGVTGRSSVGVGVSGESASTGIYGTGNFIGVGGYSVDGYGGNFTSDNSYGIVAATTNGAYAGVFYGNMYTSGTLYQSSDKNLKTNIQELGDAMGIINKLKPKNYEFRKDNKYASLNLPKGSHYGLLAQDLQEVLPNLVLETPHKLSTVKPVIATKPTADGKQSHAIPEQKETKETINIKAVNYIELIPIMVKAMQEQQTQIQDLKAKNEELTQLVNKLSQNTSTSGSIKLNSAFLGQNTPNPNRTSTRISYSIPTDSRAELVVNNTSGQKIKQIQLSKSGVIDLNTSGLNAGTYFYTLFVNGKSIDTKKMIVNR